MNARDFIDGARRQRGARWRHRGRQVWAVDCIGLIVLAARFSGLPFQDEKGYGREPWEDRLRNGLRLRFGDPLPVAQAQPGDIALLKMGPVPSHIGIVADHPDGGLSLVHSRQIHGVVEQRIAGPVAAAMVEVYRPAWGAS